ncbi:hypothetical protein HYU19_06190 [Candidatus Woesearchaeota archaeon]|nr:hypothetical protein [Candidatus Woesearchaeota archaeon]
MTTDPLALRELEIFQALQLLEEYDLVVIGGYAVNAYALPRFSVDCDIVVRDKKQANAIEHDLLKNGYKKENPLQGELYAGSFFRYEKQLENEFIVSIDLLFGKVTDRLTGVIFSADWIFENSKVRQLKGKTITKQLNVRIINIDALIVMKAISCRATDIRDVFMLFPAAQEKEWIRSEISKHYDLKDRVSKILAKVTSKQFRDGLSGVYGYVDSKTFDRHMKAVMSLEGEPPTQQSPSLP